MNVAVIAAGGTGERVGLSTGKQLAVVAGRPVLSHTLSAFISCEAVDAIVVVVSQGRLEETRRSVSELASPKVLALVEGGETRQASVANGLAEVPEETDIVLVHDGARPLVTPALIASVIGALQADDGLAGLVVGHPAYDTLKQVDDKRLIVSTPDRSLLWAAQTPQVFRAGALRRAYDAAAMTGYSSTDDASLVERSGGLVAMFPGPRDNLKITVPEDLVLAGALLALRSEGGADG